MRSSRVTSVLAALIAAACAFGCARPRPWNVVLVTLDTTRADRIGCYGDPTATTPNLDRLAAEGVRFARATSPAPMTLPAHTSILTGKYPPGHGVRDNGLYALAQEQQTLAEILKAEGYATAAAIAGFPLVAAYGLDQGFDLYDDRLARPRDRLFGPGGQPQAQVFGHHRRGALVNEVMLPWLERHAGGPFFAWLHYYDPHHPREPLPPYDQLHADDPYAAEIAYADECLGAVLDRLQALGLWECTLIVVTADHGEGLGDHRESTHSYLVYEATQHVPLIVRAPDGRRGAVVDDPVSLVDIAPTVLDLLGLEQRPAMQGQSLVALLAGAPAPARPLYAETLSPRLSHGWGELRALYQGRWKYIHGPRPELYDLAADPGELANLVAAEPALAERLQAELASFLASHAAAGSAPAAPIDEQSRQQLMALGYVDAAAGAGLTVTEELRSGGAPPQDRVVDVNALSAARELLYRGRAMAALAPIQRLLAGDPGNAFYLQLLATAELQLGQADAALAALDRVAPSQTPGVGRLLLQAGYVLWLQGRREEGMARVSAAVDAAPDAAGTHLLASMYADLGMAAEEMAALEKALELDPEYAPAMIDHAVRLAERGETERAEQELAHTLASHPYDAHARFNYGTFLVQSRRLDEAVAMFERAVELDPSYTLPYRALVIVQLERGDLERARQALAALEAVAPTSPEAEQARRLVEEHG